MLSVLLLNFYDLTYYEWCSRKVDIVVLFSALEKSHSPPGTFEVILEVKRNGIWEELAVHSSCISAVAISMLLKAKLVFVGTQISLNIFFQTSALFIGFNFGHVFLCSKHQWYCDGFNFGHVFNIGRFVSALFSPCFFFKHRPFWK